MEWLVLVEAWLAVFVVFFVVVVGVDDAGADAHSAPHRIVINPFRIEEEVGMQISARDSAPKTTGETSCIISPNRGYSASLAGLP